MKVFVLFTNGKWQDYICSGIGRADYCSKFRIVYDHGGPEFIPYEKVSEVFVDTDYKFFRM